MSEIAIRLAKSDDLQAINEIYNHYVLNSTCTYQEQIEPIEGRHKWFESHDQAHPVTIAELNGEIVGWGSLSSFHPRSAYRFTVEDTVYVKKDMHRRGIGTAILADLITRARTLGHHAMITAIHHEETASIELHKRFGFQKVGQFNEVGFKFNRWLHVVYLELVL